MNTDADTIYTIWRYVNILLAVMAGSLVLGKAKFMWPYLDAQSKFLYAGVVGFCAWAVWGNLEVILRGIPGGPRTILGTIPLVWWIISGLLSSSPARMSALRRMREMLDRQGD